jgi:gamma-glutamylcyclotransferase (GGCT)/AIG2-like uncharacterized protein YtfP
MMNNMPCAHVFTYGSLMFPEVWHRVVKGQYRSAPATAPGHARFAVLGETYPGMVVQTGSSVPGVVYFDVEADDIAALDVFEGNAYQRDRITVQMDGDDTPIAADTYLFLPSLQLSNLPWQPEAFGLRQFLASYCH